MGYLHIFTNLTSPIFAYICIVRMDLCPQHGAHGFQWYAVGQRNGSGKCMPRGMSGEVLSIPT